MNAIAALPTPARSRAASHDAWSIRRGALIDGLQRERRANPSLRGHEVRVRIRAVGLNHRDLMIANGLSGSPGQTIVPGSDAAGEVVEVGADVSTLQVGDRVIGSFFPDWLAGPATPEVTARALGGSMDGVLAEQVVLPESAWVPIPAGLGFVEAATLPCAGVTAWNALFCVAPVPPGSTVLLLGTGGVSIWALQLARAAGHRVIVTSSDDTKLDRARALGADGTINYRSTPAWGEAARQLTDGVGVDRVLDIGGPATLAESITALRMGGTVAVIGRLTGSTPAQFDPAALFAGNKRLAGLMVGNAAMSRELARFVSRAGLQPVIDRVFAFHQARDAYRHLASGQHVGKVVIAVGDE
jgi:NADPH:quinone reductase-like Zn-dependent oxidoreductase